MPQRLLPAAAFLLVATFAAQAQPRDVAPQYVVISFDGAGPLAQWQRSRELSRKTGAHFTYFLSCVYLLSPETKAEYQPPRMKKGRSNVGFATSRDDVAGRLREIWAARREGHEIASHGCGHFDGKDWSAQEWSAEFNQFSRILRDAWTINRIPYEPEGWRRFAASEVSGFRAPYLSVGETLMSALAKAGFAYDASAVSRGPAQPGAHGPLVTYSLPMVPEGPASRPVIAMDYNLYVRHSGGNERASQAEEFEARALSAFNAAFDSEYHGKRRTLQLGFHFTLMNDGAYWRALERFAEGVCMRSDVRCVSYAELTEILAPAHTGDTDD